MSAIVACSLHPMDIRLLRLFISAMQGGPIPDFTEEVTRRAHRDILLSWSHKMVKAAAPLAAMVPPERWLLYTQLRPFFITTDDPAQAAALAERFFCVASEEDVINLFREEIARIDPEQADGIVDLALRDRVRGPLAHFPPDEMAAQLRAYLLYQRRQLEALATEAAGGSAAAETVAKAGRLLAWRTCYMLANLHPSWQTRAVTLTNLASRQELGLLPLVADPRGMYAGITQRIPGLHAQIPYHLSDDRRTGLCINPQCVPAVLSAVQSWPSPLPAHPGLGTPVPVEVQALQEALLYAQTHHAGLWEASGMVVPAAGVFPQLLPDQGELDEREEQPAPAATAVDEAAAPPAAAGQSTEDEDDQETLIKRLFRR